MRVGSNPYKEMKGLKEQQEVTVAVLNYLPLQSGYFKEGLMVLKLCLESIRRNTKVPINLLVFDNGSTSPVVNYLVEEHSKGKIDYLILSNDNVGKVGAWNIMLKAAPGKFIAYTDGDVYFYPGWLEQSLEIIKVFPKVGMVTAMPLRHRSNYHTDIGLGIAKKHTRITLKIGKLLSDETIRQHCSGVGYDFTEYMKVFGKKNDVLLSYKSVQAFLGATHFQYLTRKSTIEKFLPFDVTAPLTKHDDQQIDMSINKAGLLKLSTTKPLIYHLGNQLSDSWNEVCVNYGIGAIEQKKKSILNKNIFLKVRENRLIRRILLKIYNLIFDLYFRMNNDNK